MKMSTPEGLRQRGAAVPTFRIDDLPPTEEIRKYAEVHIELVRKKYALTNFYRIIGPVFAAFILFIFTFYITVILLEKLEIMVAPAIEIPLGSLTLFFALVVFSMSLAMSSLYGPDYADRLAMLPSAHFAHQITSIMCVVVTVIIYGVYWVANVSTSTLPGIVVYTERIVLNGVILLSTCAAWVLIVFYNSTEMITLYAHAEHMSGLHGLLTFKSLDTSTNRVTSPSVHMAVATLVLLVLISPAVVQVNIVQPLVHEWSLIFTMILGFAAMIVFIFGVWYLHKRLYQLSQSRLISTSLDNISGKVDTDSGTLVPLPSADTSVAFFGKRQTHSVINTIDGATNTDAVYRTAVIDYTRYLLGIAALISFAYTVFSTMVNLFSGKAYTTMSFDAVVGTCPLRCQQSAQIRNALSYMGSAAPVTFFVGAIGLRCYLFITRRVYSTSCLGVRRPSDVPINCGILQAISPSERLARGFWRAFLCVGVIATTQIVLATQSADYMWFIDPWTAGVTYLSLLSGMTLWAFANAIYTERRIRVLTEGKNTRFSANGAEFIFDSATSAIAFPEGDVADIAVGNKARTNTEMIDPKFGETAGTFTTKLDFEASSSLYILPGMLVVLLVLHGPTCLSLAAQYHGINLQSFSNCYASDCTAYNDVAHYFGDAATYLVTTLLLVLLAMWKLPFPVRAFNSGVTRARLAQMVRWSATGN